MGKTGTFHPFTVSHEENLVNGGRPQLAPESFRVPTNVDLPLCVARLNFLQFLATSAALPDAPEQAVTCLLHVSAVVFSAGGGQHRHEAERSHIPTFLIRIAPSHRFSR